MHCYCVNCRGLLKTGMLCSVCENYVLCPTCYEQDGHLHEMKQLIIVFPEGMLPKDQSNGCAFHLREDPVHCFIQDLARAYQSRQKTARGACQFIFEHFSETNLVCNCIFCKRMLLMYKYHSEKCKVRHQCPLEDCPIISERLFKRRLTTESNDVIMQKLLKIRFVMKNIQGPPPRVTLDETNPALRSVALSRKFTIQRCIRTLVHACQCTETNCMPASCQKMKRILTHIKICKRKVVGGCLICKQLCTLCCYHAKTCHESKCSVLLCSLIKRKLRESKMKKRCTV